MKKSWDTKNSDPVLDVLRSSKRWTSLRKSILSAFPVCYLCRRIGCAPRLSMDIHHIVPARVMIDQHGEEGFFDVSNLVPLCRHHHDRNENAWKDGRSDILFPKEDRLTWERINDPCQE